MAKERKLGLLGRKIGMTQMFGDNGQLMGVTAILVGPCLVMSKKEDTRDGYCALQLGIVPKKQKHSNAAELGHVKAALLKSKGFNADNLHSEDAQKASEGVSAMRFLREFRVSKELADKYQIGQEIPMTEVFKEQQFIDVVAKTKGRGFQGVIKRWGFSGFRATHGTHEFFRHGGSIGNREFPGRVFKNRKMAGQYGNERVTVQNLKIVKMLPEKNIILVHGAVPGGENGLVTVSPAIKKRA